MTIMFRKTAFLASLLVVALFAGAFALLRDKTIYDYTVKDIVGNDVALSKYKGKVLLVVNVASKCGYTPQYADLQALYDEQADNGLEILGFPANNFMGQEPGNDEQINRFCTEKFGVTFPMFSKISVKGEDMHPLYQYLTQKKLNGTFDAPVKWNFQKFLIGRNGKLLASFSPGERVTDDKVKKAILDALK